VSERRFKRAAPIGDQGEHALAVALGGVAAVAVAPAQLFELVVQVAHGVSSLW
jgi:hypothetical protein